MTAKVTRLKLKRPKRLTPFRPSKPWEVLSKAIRTRLEALGFDIHSWNNNLREFTPVADADLLCVGASSSTLQTCRLIRDPHVRRKPIEDLDANRNAVTND